MTVLIIDGPYLAHRSYSAPYKLSTNTGLDSTCIHSFFRSLNAFRKKFEPEQIIMTWETYFPELWRRQLYSLYKPKRGVEQEFIEQVKDIKTLLHLFGVKQYISQGNEADDVIATFAYQNLDKDITIFTKDKDIMQLITNNCFVYDGQTVFGIEMVRQKFGILPYQIPDYLAILGDTVDNVEGIKSYGEKKTTEIIKEYGCIENIPKTHQIYSFMEQIILNKQLTTLKKDCKLLELPFNGKETIDSILNKYDLKSMQKNIDEYKLMGK